MLSWVTSLWSSGSFTGPARNAPNNGVDIKKLFDQRPKQVIAVSNVQIQTTLKGLKKTETNSVPPISDKPEIMKEFDCVFDHGYREYFIFLKNQRDNQQSLNKTQALEKLRKKPVIPPKSVNIKSKLGTNKTQPAIAKQTVDAQQTPAIALSVPAQSNSHMVSSIDTPNINESFSKEEIAAELVEFQDI